MLSEGADLRVPEGCLGNIPHLMMHRGPDRRFRHLVLAARTLNTEKYVTSWVGLRGLRENKTGAGLLGWSRYLGLLCVTTFRRSWEDDKMLRRDCGTVVFSRLFGLHGFNSMDIDHIVREAN